MENDTQTGGEGLSIDQAAAAYAKAIAPAVQKDHAEPIADDVGDTTDDELQASDEDVSEETDGDTADEDQAETGEADADQESEQGRFVADNAKVRLPDGTITTIGELKSGSLRNADYTRKTQEVAEQKRSVDSQSTAIKASEQQLAEQRDYVASLIKSIVPAAPDLALLNTDPVAYMQQEAQRKQWLDHLKYLDGQQQQAKTASQAKQAETEKETAEREWNALLGKAPELKDAKRLSAFAADLKSHGQAYGFTPQEIARVALDSRQALVLRDAINFRKLQASKAAVAKKVEGRPPVAKGGKRLNTNEQQARRVTDATSRLKETGRLDDAVAVYLAQSKTG